MAMAHGAARTALVTGANSGLGFEAAAQLAEKGYGRVIVTARSAEKAETARQRLRERTGADVFEALVLDNDDRGSVDAAASVLAERGGHIDLLLLNAGIAPTKDLRLTADGIEATMAATLIGHHLLTMRLLDRGLLSSEARIVMAGSEAARGDVPTFTPIDVDAMADDHFGGDLEAAVEAQMRMDPPASYKPSDTYATVKMFAAWWAAELASRLPAGITVNVVSPGSTPDTNAIRNAPLYMRKLMVPFFKFIPGMSHTVADGAARYLAAAEYGPDVSGKFFASPPKKMTGPLTEVRMDHLDNPAAERAVWTVTTRTAGTVGSPH